jgi:zinc transporter ZupT
MLVGFLSLHTYYRFLDNHTSNAAVSESGSRTTKRYNLGIISAWGIGVHSFVDGVIFMVTFSISKLTGIATSTALVFHEIPEGIITFLLLKEAGFSEKKSVIYAFIAAAITTPMGAIVAYPFVYSLGTQQLGILLALSAGALLYVGASQLLPESETGLRKYNLITLGLGILIAIVIVMND